MKKRQHGAISARGMALLVLILVPLLIVAFYEGRKAYWDAQVSELCAKDGGIKVYETVKLPPEMFNQWGQPNFFIPTQKENALGAGYVYRSESIYIHQGNPSLRQDREQIFRRREMKLLGESTAYVRGGGDLPGPWQPSAYWCPGARSAEGAMAMSRIFTTE